MTAQSTSEDTHEWGIRLQLVVTRRGGDFQKGEITQSNLIRNLTADQAEAVLKNLWAVAQDQARDDGLSR